jgi:hypothetical protein
MGSPTLVRTKDGARSKRRGGSPSGRSDYRAANRAAGLERTPKGYIWHHLDDYDPATNRYEQLVEEGAHSANQPHVGGVKQYQDATRNVYRP